MRFPQSAFSHKYISRARRTDNLRNNLLLFYSFFCRMEKKNEEELFISVTKRLVDPHVIWQQELHSRISILIAYIWTTLRKAVNVSYLSCHELASVNTET